MATPVINSVIIRFRPAALKRMLSEPGGEVVTYQSATAAKVVTIAKRRVGVNKPRPGGETGGKLKRSIRQRFRVGGRFLNPAIDVEAGRNPPLRYAYWHHEGGDPHEIRPKRRNMLVFFWEKKGDWAWFQLVNHPGNRENPFLVDAARIVGLRVTRARRRRS